MSLKLVTDHLHHLDSLKSSFENIIPETERLCMASLDSAVAQLQLSALQNKNILINSPITLSILMMVDILIKAGSSVYVTHAPDLVCHEESLSTLQKQGLYISFEDIGNPLYVDYFDLVIDYGGYLASTLKPKISFIELTQVEHKRYLDASSPVISINASFVNQVQTSLGTGDGFVRAIRKINLQIEEDYRKKTYLIFGYGKVGKGIAQCLVQTGVATKQIIIVEVRDKPLRNARSDGFMGYNLVNQYEAVRLLLPSIHCAVTATGMSGAISRYFTASDFEKIHLLTNMGTYDEWGQQFSTERVLNQKKPLNYILEFPTRVFYLDAIYALTIQTSAHAAKQTFENRFAVIKPPKLLQKQILDQWIQKNPNANSWETLESIAGEKFDFV